MVGTDSGEAGARPSSSRTSGDRRGRWGWARTLVNLVLYEAGWFGCVLAAADGRPVLALAAVLLSAAVHVALAADRSRELALMMAAAVLGGIVDSVTVRLGVLRFAAPLGPEGMAPVWVVGMWAQFAIVFRFCLAWMSGRYWSGALLGAVGGPLSFVAGARLGAVELLPPLGRSVTLLAVLWALALPTLLLCADRLGPRGSRAGSYRFERSVLE
jgi:hypothetical protein